MSGMNPDVVVAGAGASGMCAALAAARLGSHVLLLEKGSIPGGTNTQSLVGPLMGFHAGQKQVVRGLAQEIVDRLERRGGTLGHLPDPLGVTSTLTPIDPEILKQVYFEMLREEKNITLLLHTFVTGAHREGKWLRSLRAVHKGGETDITAPVFIDATGDADVAHLAGVPCVYGRPEDGFAQPMTLVIRADRVDLDRVRRTMRLCPDQFVLRKDALDMPYVAVSGYFDKVRRAREKGTLTFPRDRVLFFQGVREGEVILNMSRVVRHRSTDAFDLTKAEIEGRRQADEIMDFLREEIDGFQQARLIQTGDAIGVRESRHIRGDYTLTEEDILNQAVFDDSVAICAFPIDLHDPLGKELHWTKTDPASCFDVPYRVMLPENLGNLLVTGRCVSATHQAAASLRITPTAMALGQAAGTAASMAPAGNVRNLSLPALHRVLLEMDAVPGRSFLP